MTLLRTTGSFAGCHLLFESPELAEHVLDFEEILDRARKMHRGIEPDQGARSTVQTDRRPRERGVIGDLLAPGDAAGVGHVRVDHVEDLVVQVRTESAHQFDLFAGKQRDARGALQFQPRLRIVDGQRVFDPQWIGRFDRLTQADGAARIELPGAMHREIDILAGRLPQVGVAPANLAEHRTVQRLHERIPTAAIAATAATSPASPPATAPAAAYPDAEFERRETLRLLFHALGPGAALARIQHVRDITVRIDGRGSAHRAAEKLIERFVENLSGEVP